MYDVINCLQRIIIRPHRITKMRFVATDVEACFVCLSVTTLSPAKTPNPIEMPFGMWTRVGPRNHGDPDASHCKGHF